jgi:hypothetical protein
MKSIISLVLGLLSVVWFVVYGLPSVILGFLAMRFAKAARRQVHRGEASPDSLRFARVGWVLGLIGLVLGILVVMTWCYFIFDMYNHGPY